MSASPRSADAEASHNVCVGPGADLRVQLVLRQLSLESDFGHPVGRVRGSCRATALVQNCTWPEYTADEMSAVWAPLWKAGRAPARIFLRNEHHYRKGPLSGRLGLWPFASKL